MGSAAVLLVAASMTGCVVETAGWAAVAVDENGDVVGLIQMCDHHVDGATLYRSDVWTQDEVDHPILGRWESDTEVIDDARWSFAAASNGWVSLIDFEEPEAGGEYVLYGWTHDDSWSALSAHFTVDDLASLRPGEVIYGDHQVATEIDFRAHVCDDSSRTSGTKPIPAAVHLRRGRDH
jgi:hypothetical protein